MALKKSEGDMYPFIDYTFNTVAGFCVHNCSYCYMKKHELSQIHLKEKEFNTNLGSGRFIFVGSGCDLFAEDIPKKWIYDTFQLCGQYYNKYMFHTKNPKRFYEIIKERPFSGDHVLCGTIETNRHLPHIMRNAPTPKERANYMNKCATELGTTNYVTIEPIMDFDLTEMIDLIKTCKPKLVSVGADSKHSNLPEPKQDKIMSLLAELHKFTDVYLKKNLRRVLYDDCHIERVKEMSANYKKQPADELIALF